MSELPEDVDARVDELYCRPLDNFVPERAALVKELRAQRRRTEAEAVAKLAKPSVAAWAVNQVVRSRAKAARELWAAGDAVLGVQERAVAGKASGGELREALAAQRAALAPLADAARGLLTGRGAFLGEQAVQAVIETLHAAAVDRAARPDVERGRLSRPLRLAGLGAMPSGAVRPAKRAADEEPEAGEEQSAPAGAKRAGPGAAPDDDAAAAEERAASERAAREAAAEERRRAKERERELASARRDLDRARRARDAAAARVDRRRAELEEAEAELERLEDEVREAEDALGE